MLNILIQMQFSTIMVLLFSILSVRTSNFQRTIDSARCVVVGMFGKEQLKGVLNHHCYHEGTILVLP